MKNLWMCPKGNPDKYAMAFFRNVLTVKERRFVNFEFAADEDCQLFLDGNFINRIPEIGAESYWYKQRLTLELSPGKHVLVARVLAFGPELSAKNRMPKRSGFFCTLKGNWEAQTAVDCKFEKPWPDWGVFPRIIAGKNFNYGAISGENGDWTPVDYFEDERVLHEPELPDMTFEPMKNFTVKDNLVYFEDYVTCYSKYVFRGHGKIKIRWAENAYLTSEFNRHNLKGEKGRRDGNFLVGTFDEFTVDSDNDATYFDFQWRAGRILEIICDGDCRVVKMDFYRSHYPYQRKVAWNVPEKDSPVLQMAENTLFACSHDTFMDCPFYERLMYVGDAKIEALSAYAAFQDNLLAKKAMRFFARSQQPSGAVLSRYPAQIEQMIPSFIPSFITMLYDFALWNNDAEFVAEMLPAVRKAAQFLLNNCHSDGLLYLPGWNFIDWQWPQRGVPFGSDSGTNSIINNFGALAFRQLAEVESAMGNSEDFKYWKSAAEQLYKASYYHFFDEKRQLFADDFKHQFYSEHAQVLALLNENQPELLKGLADDADLTRCGIYFSYYYLEACFQTGRMDLFSRRFDKWQELSCLGLKTLPEEFLNPRSDCHAWSSHILYHYLASVQKKRPAGLRCHPEKAASFAAI